MIGKRGNSKAIVDLDPTLTSWQEWDLTFEDMIWANLPKSYPARPPSLAATINFSWLYHHRMHSIDDTPPPTVAGAIVTLTWIWVALADHWQVTFNLAHQLDVKLPQAMGQKLNAVLYSKQGYGFSSSCPVLFLCGTYSDLDDVIAVANALDAATQLLV